MSETMTPHTLNPEPKSENPKPETCAMNLKTLNPQT